MAGSGRFGMQVKLVVLVRWERVDNPLDNVDPISFQGRDFVWIVGH